MHTYKLDLSPALSVTLSAFPETPSEMLGDFSARFHSSAVALLEGWTLRQYNGLGEAVESPLVGEDGIQRASGGTANADAFIAALAVLRALADEGAEGSYTVDYEGSPFWMFHDVDHSRHDFDADTDTRTVDGPAELHSGHEDRANLAAALEGVRAGLLTPAQAMAELVGLQADFRQRFGTESTALANYAATHKRDASATTGEHDEDDDKPGEWEAWAISTAREAIEEDDPESFVTESADGALVYDDDIGEILSELAEYWDPDAADGLGIEDPDAALRYTAAHALECAALAKLEELREPWERLNEAREALDEAKDEHAEALAEWREAIGED